MDQRLLVALRCMRGVGPFEWKYGDSQMPAEGIALLGSLSEELGYPYEWGDPTRLPATAADARAMLETARAENAAARAAGKEVLPDPTRGGEPGFILAGAAGPRGRGEMGGVPCEVVHCGTGGSSCMANSALRWIRGWKTCMYIYVPVSRVCPLTVAQRKAEPALTIPPSSRLDSISSPLFCCAVFVVVSVFALDERNTGTHLAKITFQPRGVPSETGLDVPQDLALLGA